MSQLISTEQLKKATGYERVSDIERCLVSNRVKFLYGKNNTIFTTLDAFNAALGITNDLTTTEQQLKFEIL